MFYAILPFVAVMFWFGLSAISETGTKRELPPVVKTMAHANAALFMGASNAVFSYATANPGWTGTPTVAAISPWMGPGNVAPAGFGASIDASGSGRIVYVWATDTGGMIYEVESMTHGDASYGEVAGGQWVSPVYGVQAAVPQHAPNGSVLSMKQLSF